MELTEILSYSFVTRAIITGAFVALCCSFLGIFLVLKRLSLIGDGLAHITFSGVAIGLLLKTQPFYLALPTVLLSSLGILKLTQKARIYGDAAIGIISAVGIASGIIISNIAGGFNVDLFSYLFGSILSITKEELISTIILSIFVCLIILFNFNKLVSAAFDEDLAKVSGINTERLNTILSILTALTVVMAMRVVGIMLISALLILPSVSALQLSYSFKRVLIISIIFSISSVIIGVIASFYFNLPTGATIVFVNFLILLISFGIKRFDLTKRS